MSERTSPFAVDGVTTSTPAPTDRLAEPDPVMKRFAVTVLKLDPAAATSTMSMPLTGLRNPITGRASVATLALLMDMAAGMSNHLRRPRGSWTVSTELTLELRRDDVAEKINSAAGPVVAESCPIDLQDFGALSSCNLTCDGISIGSGSVRSFFVPGDRVVESAEPDVLQRGASTTLAELLALQISDVQEGECMLTQRDDPSLRNRTGVVHGGVASAALEVAAAGVIGAAGGGAFSTASLRVDFLRPFMAGTGSSYVASPLRVGRRAAVAEAKATGRDGRVALVARLAAYR